MGPTNMLRSMIITTHIAMIEKNYIGPGDEYDCLIGDLDLKS